jgi:uncharacterized membrane protein
VHDAFGQEGRLLDTDLSEAEEAELREVLAD